MPMSKRTLLVGGTFVAAALSTDAVAQANKQKSKTVTQVGENDAVWLKSENRQAGQIQLQDNGR